MTSTHMLSNFHRVLWSVIVLLSTLEMINVSVAQEIDGFYDSVDAFMGAYVDEGVVDYSSIQEEPAGLNSLVTMIGDVDRNGLTAEDDQAFLVNAYNVLVIKNVVDHYPIDSPLEVNGFFDKIEFEVSSNNYTLNDLEKGELFATYPDPRFHFVLVCAAMGCPELISEAYRGATLDEMLTRRSRAVLNSKKHVRTDSSSQRHQVSELFSWYKNDFTKDGMTIIEYINQYRSNPLDEDNKVEFITYDWRLNDAKKKS